VGSAEAGQLGRFRILGVLGQGQHATVYRAYDAVLDRDVALKVPRPGVLRTEKALERFLGEARAQARLHHPRIVPVYEAGRAGGRHYIAMAVIEGRGLDDRLAEEGPLAPDRAASVAAELAEALAYAHALGVVHRDVKPANVRVDHRGDVYLMDFGIAYRPDSNELPLPPGTILGTPAYVAPERAEGGRSDPLPASDQYSLGAVFYELLCGRPPFVGPPSYVLFHAIHRDPPSPRTVEPKVPRALATICLKALAKDPRRRYADCQALADDLRRWLRGETPLAHRRGWVRLGR
jgi:serine/threonine protein kinase